MMTPGQRSHDTGILLRTGASIIHPSQGYRDPGSSDVVSPAALAMAHDSKPAATCDIRFSTAQHRHPSAAHAFHYQRPATQSQVLRSDRLMCTSAKRTVSSRMVTAGW